MIRGEGNGMGNGTMMVGKRGSRRGVAAGLLVGGLLLAGLAALPSTTAAASDGANTAVQVSRGDGRDAPWLRFGLLGLLGIVLGGGAVVQYRSSAAAPPYCPKPRRKEAVLPTVAAVEPSQSTPEPESAPHPVAFTFPAPPPASVVDWRQPGTAPIALAPYRRQRADVIGQAPRREAPALSPSEEACARAVAAAHRYDRHATRDGFSAALALDPAVKPSVVASFWEMPSGGHADLANAYLGQGQILDARSVVTMALLTFPHNRELEALLREIAPERFVATA